MIILTNFYSPSEPDGRFGDEDFELVFESYVQRPSFDDQKPVPLRRP